MSAKPSSIPVDNSSVISQANLNRRRFIGFCSALGIGSAVFADALWSQAAADNQPKINKGMIDQAATVAGVDVKDEYKEMMLEGLNDELKNYKSLHDLKIPNSVPPALTFSP